MTIKTEKNGRFICYIAMGTFIVSGLGTGIYYFLNGKKSHIFMGLATILFAFIPVLLKKRKIAIPYRYYSMLFIFLILGYNIGFIAEGYHRFNYFDKIVHFLSGFVNIVTGLFIYFGMKKSQEKKWGLAVLFAFFFSLSVALGFEFAECTVFLLTGSDSQRNETTGVFDTMGDLAVCLASSALGAIYYVAQANSRRQNSMTEEFCRLNGYGE